MATLEEMVKRLQSIKESIGKTDVTKSIDALKDGVNSHYTKGMNTDMFRAGLGALLLGGAAGGALAWGRPVQKLKGESVLGDDREESDKHRNRANVLNLDKTSAVKKAEDEKKAPESIYEGIKRIAGDAASGLFNSTVEGTKKFVDDHSVVSGADTNPWTLPLIMAATGAGGYGGYKLTSNYLANERKEKQLSRIEEQRKQLDDMISREITKSGSMDKSAFKETGVLNQAAGIYGALALLLGGSGYLLGTGYLGDREKTKNQLSSVKNDIAGKQRINPSLGPILREAPEAPKKEKEEPEDQRSLNAPTPNFLDEEDDEDERIKISRLIAQLVN